MHPKSKHIYNCICLFEVYWILERIKSFVLLGISSVSLFFSFFHSVISLFFWGGVTGHFIFAINHWFFALVSILFLFFILDTCLILVFFTFSFPFFFPPNHVGIHASMNDAPNFSHGHILCFSFPMYVSLFFTPNWCRNSIWFCTFFFRLSFYTFLNIYPPK